MEKTCDRLARHLGLLGLHREIKPKQGVETTTTTEDWKGKEAAAQHENPSPPPAPLPSSTRPRSATARRRKPSQGQMAASLVSSLTVPLVSAVLGAAIALVFLAGYLSRKRAAIAHIPPTATAAAPDQPKHVRPSNQAQNKKGHLRAHHHAADKVISISHVSRCNTHYFRPARETKSAPRGFLFRTIILSAC